MRVQAFKIGKIFESRGYGLFQGEEVVKRIETHVTRPEQNKEVLGKRRG